MTHYCDAAAATGTAPHSLRYHVMHELYIYTERERERRHYGGGGDSLPAIYLRTTRATAATTIILRVSLSLILTHSDAGREMRTHSLTRTHNNNKTTSAISSYLRPQRLLAPGSRSPTVFSLLFHSTRSFSSSFSSSSSSFTRSFGYSSESGRHQSFTSTTTTRTTTTMMTPLPPPPRKRITTNDTL